MLGLDIVRLIIPAGFAPFDEIDPLRLNTPGECKEAAFDGTPTVWLDVTESVVIPLVLLGAAMMVGAIPLAQGKVQCPNSAIDLLALAEMLINGFHKLQCQPPLNCRICLTRLWFD